jgi:hypothetical protein
MAAIVSTQPGNSQPGGGTGAREQHVLVRHQRPTLAECPAGRANRENAPGSFAHRKLGEVSSVRTDGSRWG